MAITSPRSSARSFKVAPTTFYGDIDGTLDAAIASPKEKEAIRSLFWQVTEWQRQQSEVVNGLMSGKDNATGTVTLTINVASTTLTDKRIGADTKVVLTPTTANAATEFATLYQTFPNTTDEQAVLNHANNAQADRTFAYILRG